MIFITALFSLIVTISIFSQIYIYICFLEWYIEYFSNKRSKFSLEEKKLNKIRSVDSEVSMTIFSVNLFINRGPYNFLSWFFWFKDYQIFFLRDIPWTEPSRDNDQESGKVSLQLKVATLDFEIKRWKLVLNCTQNFGP